MNIQTWTTSAILCISILAGTTACAASEKKADAANATQDQQTSLSSDQRKAMAEMHQKMADCLKSDKSLQECQDQMRQSCQTCNGMKWYGNQGHHHGMMNGGHCGMMDW